MWDETVTNEYVTSLYEFMVCNAMSDKREHNDVYLRLGSGKIAMFLSRLSQKLIRV